MLLLFLASLEADVNDTIFCYNYCVQTNRKEKQLIACFVRTIDVGLSSFPNQSYQKESMLLKYFCIFIFHLEIRCEIMKVQTLYFGSVKINFYCCLQTA